MLVPTPSLVLELVLLCSASVVHAVTVYSQQPIGQTATGSAAAASYTGYLAYNPTVLNPPALPNPLPETQFKVALQQNTNAVAKLSIPVQGSFWGFSIETSVITQVLGVNASYISVPFLNIISLIVERSGSFNIRVGGNTQETARLVSDLADHKMIEKQGIDPNNPTATPALVYTMEMFYVLSNISTLVPGVKWYLGIPFNDSSNFDLSIAKYGEQILGDRLIGFQAGNEPDLYANHKHRNDSYNQTNYFNEYGMLINAIAAEPAITTKNNLIGPSTSSVFWSPESIFDTGYLTAYGSDLMAISVEHYPSDNCAAIYAGQGTPKVPQDEFYKYLTHDGPNSGLKLVGQYLNSAGIAQSMNKEFLMFETNSASCGGFAGISNSFGAALWAVDYGMQMAFSNFTHALLHFGGQDVAYNPITPPPTGQSTFNQWTIGPIFYSVLALSDAFGSSNTSRILDITQNTNQPGYAIYENDVLTRVAYINYMTDPSGANDYTVGIEVGGNGQPGAVPAQVKVKYLTAPSVSELFNITYAGQTFGGKFQCDGRLKGTEDIVTVPCDQTANVCNIKVPAPGFALVFMSDSALSEVEPTETKTYATTALTRMLNTATVDPAALETSNGHGGVGDRQIGSTSKGSANGAGRAAGTLPGVALFISMFAAVWVFMRSAL